MSSALPEVEAPAAAFAPATPMRARPKSIHSLSLQGTPTQSPFSQQYSPHKPLWPQQAVPLGMTPFPLDPALGGPNIYAFNEDGMPMSVHSSPVRILPSSTSASHMSYVTAPFHPSISQSQLQHILSQQYGPHFMHNDGVRMDPRMMQRTHSAPGATDFVASRDPGSHFFYYHQIAGPDQQGPPIAWSTTEVALRSPPAPRQRSAKACGKCRKRKTKCSGGLPCGRCVARGLECEYDGKSLLRGPMKPRTEARNCPPTVMSSSLSDTTGSDSLRASSRSEHRYRPYQIRSERVHSADNGLSHEVSAGAPKSHVIQVPEMTSKNNGYAEAIGSGHAGYAVDESEQPVSQIKAAYAEGRYHSDSNESTYTPANSGGVWGWTHQMPTEDMDISDTGSSRPGSSCSGSSFDSADRSFVVNAPKPAVAWPSNISSHFYSTPLPLSTSSSSSSLKDALVELPRPRPRLETSIPERIPSSFQNPTSAEFATTLSNILSHSSLIERTPGSPLSAGCNTGTSSPTLSASPPSSTTTWSSAASPVTPATPSPSLQFSDVFNLSPDSKNISPSSSMDEVADEAQTLGAAIAAVESWSRLSELDSDFSARPDGNYSHGQDLSGYAANGMHVSYSASSLDMETPRAMHMFRFDGEFGSPPGLTSHLTHSSPLAS